MPADLRLLQTRPAEITKSVIDALEDTLVHAKAGEITSICICTVNRDNSFGRNWSESDQLPQLLGSLTMAAYRLMETAQSKDD